MLQLTNCWKVTGLTAKRAGNLTPALTVLVQFRFDLGIPFALVVEDLQNRFLFFRSMQF